MKIRCKNVGLLEDAEVEINKITVIAGENGTGKSTVGKALFSIFEAFHDYKKAFKIYKNSRIAKLLIDKISKSNLPNKFSISEIVAQNEKTEIASVLRKMFPDEKQETIDMLANDILIVANMSDTDFLLNKLNKYKFLSHISNIYGEEKKSEIQLTFKSENPLVVKYENEAAVTIENPMNLEKNIIFIDDPYVLEDLPKYFDREVFFYGPNRIREYPRNMSLLKKLKQAPKNDYLTNKKLEQVMKIVKSATNGDIVIENGGYKFKPSDSHEYFTVGDISAGVKMFVILQTLLQNGSLEDNGIIILDEPEIHLHPQYHNLCAEILVLLQKEFGIHILITSHSTYFIDAIDKFSQIHGIRKDCKFYLTELDKETHRTEVNDVSDDISPIFATFYRAMEYMDKLLEEHEDKNER